MAAYHLDSRYSKSEDKSLGKYRPHTSWRLVDQLVVFRLLDETEGDAQRSSIKVQQCIPAKQSALINVVASFVQSARSKTPFSFAVPHGGSWFYCSVAQVSELLDGGVKQCLCLISRYPVLSFMEATLEQLVGLCSSRDLQDAVALEPFVRSLVFEFPIPPHDRTLVAYWEREGVFSRKILIARPRCRHLPFLDDRSLIVLTSLLPPNKIVSIVEHLLQENSLVVHSCPEEAWKLLPVLEGIKSLLYPFTWQGLYFSFLPRSEWDHLTAPIPALLGVACRAWADFVAHLRERASLARKPPRPTLVLNLASGALERVGFLSDAPHRERLASFPEPVRSRLITHLTSILSDRSPEESEGDQVGPTSPFEAQNHGPVHRIRSLTSLDSLSTISSIVSATTSASADTSSSSGSDPVTSEASIWTDWFRIAFLEAFLSLFSHTKYHILESENSKNGEKQATSMRTFNSSPATESQEKVSTSSEYKPLGRCASAVPGALSNAALSYGNESLPNVGQLDLPSLLSDLPETFRPFTALLSRSRMFDAFLQTQILTGPSSSTALSSTSSSSSSSSSSTSSPPHPTSSSVFRRLSSIWRNHPPTQMKRKLSPLMRKLQELLVGMGYSLPATRQALEQLAILSPEEMNHLFTSVETIQETLSKMGVPRFVKEEDVMCESVRNPRTAKLRSLLERCSEKVKPPLVCRVSLSKHHPGLSSSWSGVPDHERSLFPMLRLEVAVAMTVATLQPKPFVSEGSRSAELSSLYLSIGFVQDLDNLSNENWIVESASFSNRHSDSHEILLSRIDSLKLKLREKDSMIAKLEAKLLQYEGSSQVQACSDERRRADSAGQQMFQSAVPPRPRRVSTPCKSGSNGMHHPSNENVSDNHRRASAVPIFRRVEKRSSPLFQPFASECIGNAMCVKQPPPLILDPQLKNRNNSCAVKKQ